MFSIRNESKWTHAVLPALRIQHLFAIALCLPVLAPAAEPVLPFQLSVFMANGWGGPIEPFPERSPGDYHLTPAVQLSYSHPLAKHVVVEASYLHLGVYLSEWTAASSNPFGSGGAAYFNDGYIIEMVNGLSFSPMFQVGSGSRFTVRTGPSLSWFGTDLRSSWIDEVSTQLAPGFNLCADTRLANGLGLSWQYRFYHPERKSIHLLGVGLSARL